MTKAEFVAFQTWYEVVLMMGSLTFEFTDPFGVEGYIEMRFDTSSQPWSVSPSGDTTDVVVSMNMERVPA